MELSHAQKLIAQGESDTIEFKRKVAHPDKIVKELVAFANTSGGHLFIGVNDDGSIPGVKFPQDEIFALNEAIKNFCRPSPSYKVEVIPLNEKRSIVHYFMPSNQGALFKVKLPAEKNPFTYVRYMDKSIKASREVREIFKRRIQNKDVSFHFGEKEKILLEYLDRQKTITLNEFRQCANLNYYSASKTLILLVLANVLGVVPSDKGDEYFQLK
ncbi:MAG: ATP-binding protein [Bacteroidota bacterium]